MPRQDSRLSWQTGFLLGGFYQGSTFLCNVLIAPVKNENSEVILFILNFDELTELPDNRITSVPGSNNWRP